MRIGEFFFVALIAMWVGVASGQDRVDGHNGVDYRIGADDVISIVVWKNEALSRRVPVRPDGMISLPLLNDVRAAGLTPMELREVLSQGLVEYMPDPEVSVIVETVNSFKVSVIGEVRKAGRYEIKSRTSVLDLLALAEGFTEFASRSRIVILRDTGTKVERIPFNYNRVVSSGNGAENVFLQPGDTVVVP